MKRIIQSTLALSLAFVLGLITMSFVQKEGTEKSSPEKPIRLGAFSISLNVKDLKTSKAFYENLGFSAMGGSMESNYLIMKNENTLIGIFQGFFEGHMLTFNPGWDNNAKNLKKWDDVRVIQKHLKSKNVPLIMEAADTTKGPAFIMLKDPDGNMILIDQHR
jgi:predicted enzyme related to lactoylglutathione lyase